MRLGVALSCVLAALVLAFGLQTFTLQRIDRIIDSMEDHDEEERLVLQIGAAIHEQYGHQGQFVLGKGEGFAEYEQSRQRTIELVDRLAGCTHDPRTSAILGAIRDAATELDRVFREQVVPAVRGDVAPASLVHDRSHPLVAAVQHRVDEMLAELQATISASRDDLRAVESTSIRWLAVGLAVTALLFGIAVLYLSRSVARPLALLTKGAAVLGSGDLDYRIPIDTPDEFGALAGEVNDMAASLKEHQARLVESEKLAAIGRVAAGIAHEINNPLQVMLGFLSLNRGHRDQRLAAQLAAVEEETLRCKHIVDGMLELSLPEVSLDLQPVDLRQLCDDISGRLGPLAQPAKVRLAVSGAASALADRFKLRQALFNLMKNAVEAAGAEGQVDIQVGEADGGPQVRVSDTGPGVPLELRDRLFEPLFTTKESGTGLGLAVSRAIVRAHGGDIDACNGDERGAVFVLRLPRVTEQGSLA